MRSQLAMSMCLLTLLAVLPPAGEAKAEMADWTGSYNVNFDWTCNGMDDNIRLRWVLRGDGLIIQIRYYDDGSEPLLTWGDWQNVGPNGFSAQFTNGGRFEGTLGPTGIAGSITAPSQACFNADRRYLDNGDGTVTSVETGRVWQAGYSPEPRSWQEANDYCANLDLGGHQDWGLPTQPQLYGLRNLPRVNYHLDDVFQQENGAYWTSTSCGESSFQVEVMDGNQGAECRDGEIEMGFVRCVVGGAVSESMRAARAREFVSYFYQNSYWRLPSQEDYDYWVPLLVEGTVTGSIFALRVFEGEDYTRIGLSNLSHVNNLFWALYGRPPSDAERSYWVGVLDSGTPRVWVNNQFIYSENYQQYCQRYGIRAW